YRRLEYPPLNFIIIEERRPGPWTWDSFRDSPSSDTGWAMKYGHATQSELDSGQPYANWLDFRVPYWFLTGVLSVIAGMAGGLILKRRARGGNGLCPPCGYALRATPDRCPECGTSVPRTSSP